MTIILKRCGPCPDFASLTLAFALQLRKSTEKPQSGWSRNAVSHYQNTHTITIPTISTPTILHKPHTSIQYKTHTYTPPHMTKIYKTTQYNYKQVQYNHAVTIPTN